MIASPLHRTGLTEKSGLTVAGRHFGMKGDHLGASRTGGQGLGGQRAPDCVVQPSDLGLHQQRFARG